MKITNFKITETEYAPIVRWEELERVLGKKEYARFTEWIAHQSAVKEGAYVGDVKRFLRGDNSLRF